MKSFVKELGVILGKMLIACVVMFGLLIAVEKLLIWTFPENYLFYESQKFPEWLYVVPPVIFASLVVEFHGDPKKLWKSHKGGCIAFVIAVVFYILYSLTSVAYVTPDTVTSRNLLNPMGTTYQLSEVEKVETGFGANDGGFFTLEYKELGSFYYKVYVDGKEIVFHSTIPNNDIERYMEDSYLELEEFDQKLVSFGIPKDGDPAGSGLCDYDQYYVDRFLRIIGEN